MEQPEDFFGHGLVAYASRLRRRDFTAHAATSACLTRIGETNDKLMSFVHVAEEAAIESAREADRLLAEGTDLGPLMGVPIAVKDLYSVGGMPTRLGSRLDFSDVLEPEGSLVQALRRAGCVILGKTRTTEFALGGINFSQPTPWNPRDPAVHRSPGGSSSGSAVAVAAGQCAFAIGSDTGGSVRQPAALCGLTGYKASAKEWRADGVFALSPTLDSLGWITRSAADTASVYSALGGAELPSVSVRGLRLGMPGLAFPHELDADIAEAFTAAVGKLTQAGAEIVALDLPELRDADGIASIVAMEFIERIGWARLEAQWDLIDPVPRARLSARLERAEYDKLLDRRRRLIDAAREVMRAAALDCWIMPTVPHRATPHAEINDLEAATRWNSRTFRITRLANILDQCAISLPLPLTNGLSAGLQISCRAGEDGRLLGTACAIESLLRE